MKMFAGSVSCVSGSCSAAVRRQIYQGEEEEEEERVLMTDKRGKTDIRLTEEVVSDNKEVLM